jgi:hypothetical protein
MGISRESELGRAASLQGFDARPVDVRGPQALPSWTTKVTDRTNVGYTA